MCRCRSGVNKKYEINEETIQKKYHVYDLYEGKHYHGTLDDICKAIGVSKNHFIRIMQEANRGKNKKYSIKEDLESAWMDN